MVRYMKCPRCELNYIDAEKQEYCDICLKEMKGLLTDLDEIEEQEDEELPTELCPVCGENMMRAGEKMCDECKKKSEYDREDTDPEEDDEWREYLDDDDSDAMNDEEMGELSEEFGGEFSEPEEEEEEEEYHGDDEEDMDYVTVDELYDQDSDDEDDDEDDDDEDDF